MTATTTKPRPPIAIALALMALLACGLLTAGSALAATPSQLWQAPPESDAPGPGAGQLDGPTGIGVDPNSGQVFVADVLNARIDEFTPWGVFVKAFGWGVRNGAAELQSCGPGAAVPSGCQKGTQGAGAGQLTEGARGVAVDGEGDVYVDEPEDYLVGNEEKNNLRVQKFDPSGGAEGKEARLLWMAGGEVNKTKTAEAGSTEAQRNLCTAAELEGGDLCGAGTTGVGKGQFSPAHPELVIGGSCCSRDAGGKIAIGPNGNLFVGDRERIEELEPSGAYKAQVTTPAPENQSIVGETVQSLAMDGAGNFYVGLWGEEGARKLDPSGKELRRYAIKGRTAVPAPEALAVDAAGDLYAVAQSGQPSIPIGEQARVVEFDPAGNKLIPSEEEEKEEGENGVEGEGTPFAEIDDAFLFGLAVSEACNIPSPGDLFVSAFHFGQLANLRAFGPTPDPAICPPPPRPPAILDQYAIGAGPDTATLQAKINPHFWTDTRYYVEYGAGKCTEGGCEAKRPTPPGALLPGAGVDGALKSGALLLTGLTPNTTYHYRFVAQSSGGGPVYGADPDGEGPEGASFAEGTEASFTTPSVPKPPPSPDPCPNAANRAGASAPLPDCRAYELVSPVDKNGGDIVGICNINCFRTELNQASADGEALTYSSYKGFAGSPGGLFSNQYIARRGASGWSTRGISPRHRVGLFEATVYTYEADVEFKAFSEDLSSAWLVDSSLDPLSADAAKGFVNAYRRDNGAESYEALTRSAPTLASDASMALIFEGASADGSHALLQARAALTPDAAASTNAQLYDYSNGQLKLASVLPDGSANPQSSSAGVAQGTVLASHGGYTLEHAISADGSSVFWTSTAGGNGPGKLYVRIDGEETIAVSAGTNAQFWSANPSGSEALYSEGKDLFRFDVETQARTLVAHEVVGVAGQSEDLSRVYLVSKKALATGAKAGERNLYLDEEGSFTFIAALSGTDTEAGLGSLLSDDDPKPNTRMTRVTPDGGAIAFMSNRPLTGYDNTDAKSGAADWEAFVYEAGAQQLLCASCEASGVRPGGRELPSPYRLKGAAFYETGIQAAAWLDTSETSFHASRALSADGRRLFFNSYIPLVARDTNGAQDVYEWEAPGEGSCSEESGDYHAANGGCVSLVSSGESPQDSVFVDASPDGRDAFFKTSAGLLPQDPGLIDVYDAREGGGYPPPPVPPPPCVGDACQSVPAAPSDPTPASAGFHGAGNPSPHKAKKHHKHRHKRRHARHHRRAGR